MDDNPNIAHGLWLSDPKTGERKWSTGDGVMARTRQTAKAETRRLADAVAKMFADERRRHREEIAELRAELAELKSALPLRSVGTKNAA